MKKIALLVALFIMAAPVALFAQNTTVSANTYQTSQKDIQIWYQGELNLGYGLGGRIKIGSHSEDAKYTRPFIETIHGVRITQYAFVGIGAGFQYAYDKEWEIGMMPTFIDLKGYYPVTKDFAPYVAIDLGFSTGVSGTKDIDGEGLDLKGGFYASYGLGLNYKQLNFGLGWQHQGMKLKYDDESSAENFSVNSFFVKVGLKF